MKPRTWLAAVSLMLVGLLAAPAIASSPNAAITSPTAGEQVAGDSLQLAAYNYDTDDVDDVFWAVRHGSDDDPDCSARTDVAGNVRGNDDPYTWSSGEFSATVDVGDLPEGEYCFALSGFEDVRLVQFFSLVSSEDGSGSDDDSGSEDESGSDESGSEDESGSDESGSEDGSGSEEDSNSDEGSSQEDGSESDDPSEADVGPVVEPTPMHVPDVVEDCKADVGLASSDFRNRGECVSEQVSRQTVELHEPTDRGVGAPSPPGRSR